MDRSLIAYLLLGAIALAAVAALAYARHQGHARVYRRQKKREQASRSKLRSERAEADA